MENTQNQQLQDYIKQARQAEMSDDEIKKNLLEAGWKENDFISILGMELRQKKSIPVIFKNNKIIFSVIIFLIIAGIGTATYIITENGLKKPIDILQENDILDEYQTYRNEMFGIEIKYPKNLKIIESDFYKKRKVISLNLEFYNFNSDSNEDEVVIILDINALNDATETIQELEQELQESPGQGIYKTVDVYTGDIKIEGLKAGGANNEEEVNIVWIKDGLFYDVQSVNELVIEEFISGIKLTPAKFSQSDFEQGGKLSLARNSDSRRISDTRQLQLALELYYDANGHYPAGLNLLIPETISALPKDPISGKDYIYAYYPANNPSQYHLGAVLETYEQSLDGDGDFNSFTKDGSVSANSLQESYINGFNGDDNGACGVEGAQGFCYDIIDE